VKLLFLSESVKRIQSEWLYRRLRFGIASKFWGRWLWLDMRQTVSHHHATGASSVRDASVRGAHARAIDADAKPNSSNTRDDIQPSRDSRGHRPWPGPVPAIAVRRLHR
jgi:hypothetical protein